MAVLDEIYNFRMSCEEYLVDTLWRMEFFQRKILTNIRTWYNYPDALVRRVICQGPSERIRHSEAAAQKSRGKRGSQSHRNGDTRSVQIVRVQAVPQEEKETVWRPGFHS